MTFLKRENHKRIHIICDRFWKGTLLKRNHFKCDRSLKRKILKRFHIRCESSGKGKLPKRNQIKCESSWKGKCPKRNHSKCEFLKRKTAEKNWHHINIYRYMIVPGRGKNLYKTQLFLWKKETKTFQGNASNRPNGQNIFKIISTHVRNKIKLYKIIFGLLRCFHKHCAIQSKTDVAEPLKMYKQLSKPVKNLQISYQSQHNVLLFFWRIMLTSNIIVSISLYLR